MRFLKFFSSDAEASSKRLLMIVFAAVFIIAFFIVLLMKRPIPNQDLFGNMVWYLCWLILIFGGFITVEAVLNFLSRKADVNAKASVERAKAGVSDVTVSQNVKEQNITGSGTTAIKKEPED